MMNFVFKALFVVAVIGFVGGLTSESAEAASKCRSSAYEKKDAVAFCEKKPKCGDKTPPQVMKCSGKIRRWICRCVTPKPASTGGNSTTGTSEVEADLQEYGLPTSRPQRAMRPRGGTRPQSQTPLTDPTPTTTPAPARPDLSRYYGVLPGTQNDQAAQQPATETDAAPQDAAAERSKRPRGGVRPARTTPKPYGLPAYTGNQYMPRNEEPIAGPPIQQAPIPKAPVFSPYQPVLLPSHYCSEAEKAQKVAEANATTQKMGANAAAANSWYDAIAYGEGAGSPDRQTAESAAKDAI